MRASRQTLANTTIALQAEVEARMNEGILARVRRYFDDKALRRRLLAVRVAAVGIKRLE